MLLLGVPPGVSAGAAADLASATAPDEEIAVKAAFLYRFTGYVEWPGDVLGNDFTVGVIGAPRVAEELAALTDARPVQGLPVRVLKLPASADTSRVDLLFIGSGFTGDLRRLIARHRGKPVLVVTDRPRGLEDGAIINFLRMDERLRFEVSQPAAQRANLRIDSALLAVAARVR